MNHYTGFRIEERNSRPQYKGTMYTILAYAALPGGFTPHATTLEGARDAVRARIEARLRQTREEAAGWERQLAEFDQAYADVRTLSQDLRDHREQLLSLFRTYRTTGQAQSGKFGQLGVCVDYMDTRGLLVFSLPEYENVGMVFLQEHVDLLKLLLVEAGFPETFESWNGAGCFSMSIRIPQVQLGVSEAIGSAV